MGILEFMTESPALSFFLVLLVFLFIENLAKIIKGTKDED